MQIESEDKETFISLPKYKNCFVYMLLKENEVVYVGQTQNGLYRPLSHKDKDFDEIRISYCEPKDLDYYEDTYIKKYTPIYNKQLNYSLNWGLLRLKNLIQEETAFSKYTIPKLRKLLSLLSIKPFEDFYTKQLMITNEEKDIVMDFLTKDVNIWIWR